ncbi:hypothetical protein RMCBS344292_03854 [Rhizopus microsporus]|nr:hypothetical protein RMCBS344292_03854 [Rhizopus microsporus]
MHQYSNTSDQLVQYHFNCKADEAFCSKISNSINAAINEFTQVVNIKVALLLKISYYSFCEISCSNSTYGWGVPTSQFTLPFDEDDDLSYIYPQALAKQLAPYSSHSLWSNYDLEIAINHDVYMNSVNTEQAIRNGWNGTSTPPNGKFWFSNDTDILDYQVDFRAVFLHELLHGLGILSSWAAYFWTKMSPFRMLIDGIIDPLKVELVTPSPYWFVDGDAGPAYLSGFQPTMIFDKHLTVIDDSFNTTRSSFRLSELAVDMQKNFCVNNTEDAFIFNFVQIFSAANQSVAAHKLWVSLSQPETLRFQFRPPPVANSSFNRIDYLNRTYESMTLLTGQDMFAELVHETVDPSVNRPGLKIAHLDDMYADTVDFLMTRVYHPGRTLESLVTEYYNEIPEIRYNTTMNNSTVVEKIYRSPIGPGILRMLDSLKYSTVLTNTNYTTDESVKTLKPRTSCDNNNANQIKTTPSSISIATSIKIKLTYVIVTLGSMLFVVSI